MREIIQDKEIYSECCIAYPKWSRWLGEYTCAKCNKMCRIISGATYKELYETPDLLPTNNKEDNK